MKNKQNILLLFCLFSAFALQAQHYKYYFGNIHAHSSYSDGNKDSVTSLMTTPLHDFNYAKLSQQTDFYGISEHNHYSAGLRNRAHYHMGLADAEAATVNGSFVAMYGMEWGVISGGGHVLVYGYDSLLGWDANYFDEFVAKNDYGTLWNKINKQPASFAYLAHPQTGDYSNLFGVAYNSSIDSAIIGMPSRSGSAFSTNDSYSDPSSGNYISRYQDALKAGYHVGIGLDHDTHYSVFGRQTAGRLVVMSDTLTKDAIMMALKDMRFYSSDDWNTEVNFEINGYHMGTSATDYNGAPQINVTVNDPDNETTSMIELFTGTPGSGSAPTVVTSNNNSNTLLFTDPIPDFSRRYYYAKITQTDGDIIWTSPIWFSRKDIVGVQENLQLKQQLKLYPNPSKEDISISFGEIGGVKDLSLFNMQGQLLWQKQTSETSLKLTVAQFPSGIYHLYVRSNKASVVEKIQVIK